MIDFLCFLRYRVIRAFYVFLFYTWSILILSLNLLTMPFEMLTGMLFGYTIFHAGLFFHFLDETLDDIDDKIEYLDNMYLK